MTTGGGGGVRYHVYRRTRGGRGYKVFSDAQLALLSKKHRYEYRPVAAAFRTRLDAQRYVYQLLTAADEGPPARPTGKRK